MSCYQAEFIGVESEKVLFESVQEKKTFCSTQDLLNRLCEVTGICQDNQCHLEKENIIERVSNTIKNNENKLFQVQVVSRCGSIKSFGVI